MVEFNCFKKNNRSGKITEKWTGKITEFKDFGSHYEMRINSRSGILVIFGRCTCGWFASIPDWKSGCYLADPGDTFYNTERLEDCMKNKIDAITVAAALAAVYELVKQLEEKASKKSEAMIV